MNEWMNEWMGTLQTSLAFFMFLLMLCILLCVFRVVTLWVSRGFFGLWIDVLIGQLQRWQETKREREKGRVGDMQQGALGRDSNPKPCSEDEASAHGTPARPTGLKPARPNDFHGLFSTWVSLCCLKQWQKNVFYYIVFPKIKHRAKKSCMPDFQKQTWKSVCKTFFRQN